jgi:uncharacterized protein
LKKLFYILFIWVGLLNFGLLSAQQTDIPKLKIEEDGLPAKPSLQTQQNHSIYDYAQLLSPSERQRLEQKISKYYDSTSTQIVVATINKVNDDISLYSTEWAHKWGIGQKDKGNGVFILVSKDDRKISIRTGYGVEHLLTDALSRRIIEQKIIPYFRKGDYYGGLNAGIESIFQVLKGEYKAEPNNEKDEGIPVFFIIIFIIIILIIFSGGKDNQSGGGSWRSSGGGPIIFSSGGRSSWGGGSFGGFGGGGFSGGFGGGGFGGGGATGSW